MLSMAHTITGKNRILTRANRIKGQIEAFSKAVESEVDEYEVMRLLASCRGALNGLTVEILEGHIKEHIVGAKDKKLSAEAGEDLIEIIHSFMK